MSPPTIRFDDGAAYERGMAQWSRRVGRTFLDWMAPDPGLTWLDIGCGNGIFTEMIIESAAPAEAHGVDPSRAQIDFARARPGAARAKFQVGDALALPFPDASVDIAVMALVIFFVPDPARGVQEMCRVVRPGGRIAAYAWDIAGGGIPIQPLWDELRASGIEPSLPPQPDAARPESLHALWSQAGLEAIEQRAITVERTFDDFEAFWLASISSGSIMASLEPLSPAETDAFKARVRARLPPPGPDGTLTTRGRANAIMGRKPARE